MNYIESLDKVIDYIEKNLKQEIILQDISDKSNYSLYHFSRIFFELIGETPCSYLRKRRLSESLIDIRYSKKKIVDIALEYQFGSQEAYTRSFKSLFKTTPLKYRNTDIQVPIYTSIKFNSNLFNIRKGDFMEPKIIKKEKMFLAGMVMSSDYSNTNNTIPQFWDKFNKEVTKVKNAVNSKVCYGFCTYPSEFPENLMFYYAPSIEVTDFENLPSIMFGKVIPEHTYAVFTHKGPVETLKETFDYIYKEWFPNSKYQMGDSFDLEYYDERFKFGSLDSEMDIYIPIKEVD